MVHCACIMQYRISRVPPYSIYDHPCHCSSHPCHWYCHLHSSPIFHNIDTSHPQNRTLSSPTPDPLIPNTWPSHPQHLTLPSPAQFRLTFWSIWPTYFRITTSNVTIRPNYFFSRLVNVSSCSINSRSVTKFPELLQKFSTSASKFWSAPNISPSKQSLHTFLLDVHLIHISLLPDCATHSIYP